ncbi:MAG TPA: FixH family protein [Candidatus Pseudogracilibacillus intestinigallinarum]|uniref:FixH family protein n=1 Tax=Candidatus Pseudogracilibacillus intestinigallinarum TaxID=2838742 RepID=A0A9D1TJI0_9BACI|nr:FixH family protein [Candidatus Pseudogracilibacillus intestinigallinarum]
MKKRLLLLFLLPAVLLFACSNENEHANHDSEELADLDVQFILPETVEAGETVEFLAEVTYGGEAEKDAEVKFEVWESGDEENSVTFEATNNEDGTYTADHTFEEAGTYEMYAHTDANHLHTMPKKEVTVE